MKKISALKGILAAALVAIMSSCGNSTSKLAEYVPADADAIMHINAKRAIENTGMKVKSNGVMELSDALENIVKDAGLPVKEVAKALEYTEGLDLSSIFVVSFTEKDKYKNTKEYWYGVMCVSDADRVVKTLETVTKTKAIKHDGAREIEIDDVSIVVEDELMWFVDKYKDLEVIKKRCAANPLKSDSKLCSKVSSDKVFTLVVTSYGLSKIDFDQLPSMKDANVALTIDLDGKKFKGECVVMNDGDEYGVKGELEWVGAKGDFLEAIINLVDEYHVAKKVIEYMNTHRGRSYYDYDYDYYNY